MKMYKLINNVTGWVVFVIALITYTLTLEPTASFWDCGEFISGANKLEVVHPPGAPFFLVLGRIFTLFASDDTQVAYTINFFSGLSSAFAVLFLFWVITALAKKVVMQSGTEPTMPEIAAVICTGVVGALACTFSDTFWFSAVEGEVYALSTFFIPLVFWAILRWESSEDERYRDKWLVLIAFFFGISIGVHLMSLLAIPAIAMVYYFKKYKPTPRGTLLALVVGFILLMVVYVGIVSKLVGIFAWFDLVAVNDMGLPFGTGIITFSVILIGGIVGGLIHAHRKGKQNLHTALLSFAMVLIGFSLYSVVVIRANAIPPINMNKPADIFRMQAYVNREQYGDRPLFKGPHFNVDDVKYEKGAKKYYKGKKEYIVIGEKHVPVYPPEDMMLFPRLGSLQEDHKGAYRYMLDLPEGRDPDMGDNLWFFYDYQIKFMWFRYFMWNFAGRLDDIQGRFNNNNGEWLSGIDFIDEKRLGPIDKLPDHLKNNKARNEFYFIPFLIGLLGAAYHFVKRRNDFLVIFTLFIFTGLLEIVFFNSPPFEPRERDYTLVGSFVTYCIWIGFGVLAIFDYVRQKINPGAAVAIAFAACLVAPVLMAKDGYDDHDRSERYTARDFAINYLESCAPNAILFTQGDNDTYPLWYAQEVEGIRTDVRVVNLSLLGVDWYIEQLQYTINKAAPVKLIHTPDKYLGDKRNQIAYYLPAIDERRWPQDRPHELRKVIEHIAKEDRGLSSISILPTKSMMITVDSAAVAANKVIADSLLPKMVKQMTFNVGRNNLMKNDLMVLDIIVSNLWERPIYFAVSVDPDMYVGLDPYFQSEGLANRIVPLSRGSDSQGYGYVASDIMYDNVMNKFKWGGMERKDTVSYTVQAGDTKAAIAEKFNVGEWDLPAEVKEGQTIKVPVPVPLYLDENILRMTMNLRSNFAKLAEQLIVESKIEQDEKKQIKTEQAKQVIQRCLEVMPQQLVPFNAVMLPFPEYLYLLEDKEKAGALTRELCAVSEQELNYLFDPEAQEHEPGFKTDLERQCYFMMRLVAIASKHEPALGSELEQKYAKLLESCRVVLENREKRTR